MRAFDTTFMNFIGQNQQLKIPIYQRKYSWEKKQCDQMLKDIEEIGKTENKTHFMGSIVYQSSGNLMPVHTIIDGQQRITTLSLLLAAFVDFLNLDNRYEEEIEITSKKIVNKYLLNIDEEGENFYELQLTEDDNNIYIKIIRNLLVDEKHQFSEEDKKSRLYKTYEFFSNRINEENYKYIWKGILQLTLVCIILENEFPQSIFESLNSTGKGLESTDLIRNFLLMNLTSTQQNTIYNPYWHDIESLFEDSKESFDVFIKYYLNVKYNNAVGGNIYEAFKAFRKNYDDLENFEAIEKIVNDVNTYKNYYRFIVFDKEDNPKLRKSFKSLNQLPYTIVRPFMMQLYHDYKNHHLDLEEFIEIINYTESYMFRRSICNLDSQSLKGFFAKMYINLDHDDYLESYKYILKTKTGKSKMPTDEDFEKYFKTEDVYHSNINKYVLLKLTNFNSTETTNIDECNIEHIMPQNTNLSKEWQEELGIDDWETVHETYLHTIGNLTLTGSNSKLGDKTFIEKRTMDNGYDDSTINLNQYFQDNDITHWNKEEIIKRSDALFEEALKIWQYPEISDETKEKYDNYTIETKLDDFDIKPKEEENDNFRYWTECRDIINGNPTEYPDFNPRTPKSHNSYIISIGTTSAQIELSINSINNESKSQLRVFDEELFKFLYDQKTEIETELNTELTWKGFQKSFLISLSKTFDLKDDWTWNDSIKWQLETAKKLNTSFKKWHEIYIE